MSDPNKHHWTDEYVAEVTKQRDDLAAAMRHVKDWNDSDIKSFDDISPDLRMLKNRRDVIRKALKSAPPEPKQGRKGQA